MASFHLKLAIVLPEINRDGDARNTTFVDHLRGLRATDRELDVGIPLPVAKEERELREEYVEDVAQKLDRGRARIAVDTSFELDDATDELDPLFVVVFIAHYSGEKGRDLLEGVFSRVLNVGDGSTADDVQHHFLG